MKLKLIQILLLSFSLSLVSCQSIPVPTVQKICVQPKLDALKIDHPTDGTGVFLSTKELAKLLNYIECLGG